MIKTFDIRVLIFLHHTDKEPIAVEIALKSVQKLRLRLLRAIQKIFYDNLLCTFLKPLPGVRCVSAPRRSYLDQSHIG